MLIGVAIFSFERKYFRKGFGVTSNQVKTLFRRESHMVILFQTKQKPFRSINLKIGRYNFFVFTGFYFEIQQVYMFFL
jgi:hypothetical protein